MWLIIMILLKIQWVYKLHTTRIHRITHFFFQLDLATLEENVKADAYPTMDDFVKDTQKIFENCKLYNAEETEYAKCSAKLERFFNEKLRAATRGT